MKAAVEWKSWDELQTLSKAFQGYLEETEMIGNVARGPWCSQAQYEFSVNVTL